MNSETKKGASIAPFFVEFLRPVMDIDEAVIFDGIKLVNQLIHFRVASVGMVLSVRSEPAVCGKSGGDGRWNLRILMKKEMPGWWM